MPRQIAQGKYWLLTIPANEWSNGGTLPNGVVWLRGQQEQGGNTGFHHWQLFACFEKKVRLAGVKAVFGRACHAEPSRSAAAEQYVFKEDTALPNTRFELGAKPLNR